MSIPLNKPDITCEAHDTVAEDTQHQVVQLQKKLVDAQQENYLIRKSHSSIELDKLLGLLSSEIETSNLFDAYLVDLADEKQENLVCVKIHLPLKFRHMEKTYTNFRHAINSDFINVHSYKDNQTKIVNRESIKHFAHNVQTRFHRWEIFESITLPIVNPQTQRPIGTITGYCLNEPIALSSEKTLKNIAHNFSQALVNAQKYHFLKSRESQVDQIASEQKRFMEFVTIVNSLTCCEEIYETVTNELLSRLPFEHISIFMLENECLRCKKNKASPYLYQETYEAWDAFMEGIAYELDESDSAVSVCFARNMHFAIDDVMKVRHLPMSEKDQAALKTLSTPRSFLWMPIRHEDNAIGVIRLVTLTQAVDIGENDIQLLDLLCRFIGPAIRNAVNYETIEQQKREIELLNSNLQQKVEELAEIATHDKLTGLHNFRSFEQELERIMKTQNPERSCELSLIVVDIDRFKQFNDNYGHQAGNDALVHVANTISSLTREKDIACRYGGEEFVVILPRCNIDGAEQFAERVRKSIGDSIITTSSGDLQLTVSVGFGCYQNGEPKEKLFDRVDRALYEAKKSGRNCIREANIY